MDFYFEFAIPPEKNELFDMYSCKHVCLKCSLSEYATHRLFETKYCSEFLSLYNDVACAKMSKQHVSLELFCQNNQLSMETNWELIRHANER